MNSNAWTGLVRRMDQARIAGVCAGLAVHFGWKLKGVRIGMILLCIFVPPVGIGLYVAGALLLPAVEAGGAFRPAVFGGLFNCPNKRYANAGFWQSQSTTPPPPPAPQWTPAPQWAPAAAPVAASASPVAANDAVERVRDLELRLREIEAYMTSSRYEFDRELRGTR